MACLAYMLLLPVDLCLVVETPCAEPESAPLASLLAVEEGELLGAVVARHGGGGGGGGPVDLLSLE